MTRHFGKVDLNGNGRNYHYTYNYVGMVVDCGITSSGCGCESNPFDHSFWFSVYNCPKQGQNKQFYCNYFSC